MFTTTNTKAGYALVTLSVTLTWSVIVELDYDISGAKVNVKSVLVTYAGRVAGK